MPEIHASQIRKIYAIAQELHMVTRDRDDVLHDLITQMTGKASVKELTYDEACQVIGELEAKQGTPPPRHKPRKVRLVKQGGVSDGQKRKVWALMYQLERISPSVTPVGKRLCAIIKKELQMDAFEKDPFAWLNYKAAAKLIECLKGYIQSAQKKEDGDV